MFAVAPTSLRSAVTYRSALGAIYVLGALVAAVAMQLSAQAIDRDIANIAHERGSVLFRLIEITRDWNSMHGGVYVPVTEATRPNPYLKHPQRDVLTQDGRALTLVNPAFMTRQIAELAERAEGAKFHITSLKPIRPANEADAWESESLAQFERAGLKERLAFFAEGGGVMVGPVHRYMAPLTVKEACMRCHEAQGYRVGDIRGGISVTMPAKSLVALGEQRRRQMVVLYVAGFIVLAGLGHLVARRTHGHLVALEAVNRGQETVIAERTEALEVTNRALAEEVARVTAAQRNLDASRARYRAVVETSASGVVVLENGQITFINDRMTEIMGSTVAELTTMGMTQWAAPEDRGWYAERQRMRWAGQPVPNDYRLRLLHRDGVTIKHVDVQIRSHRDDRGAQMVVASFLDVTDLLEAEKERVIAAAVFGNAAEAIFVTDREHRILRVNPAFSAVSGYLPAEALGRDPGLLESTQHEAAFQADLWQHLDDRGRWEGEVSCRRKDGTLYVAWMSITTIAGEAGEGRHVATFIDITRRKEAEQIVLQRANFDALTHLPNRSLFEDRLIRLLATARRHERQFALLYLDIDHFKDVNDELGHAAGDAVLVEAAERMLRCVRDSDTVARMGGDEFAVILADLTHLDAAEEVARRINAALVRPFPLQEGVAQVSASIGMAIYPTHGDGDGVLRKRADQALYAAKAAGRNTYCMAQLEPQGTPPGTDSA